LSILEKQKRDAIRREDYD
jgi:hypothetical protein